MDTQKLKEGYYFGTIIDNKWWKRYKKSPYFASGNGSYNYDKNSFYFFKYPTQSPLIIDLNSINSIEIVKFFAGKWGANMPIIKINWLYDGLSLSSGFILTKDIKEAKEIIDRVLKLKS